MSLYILDTDTFTLLNLGHATVSQKVSAHAPSQLALTVITVEEQLTGWYTKIRRAKRDDDLARGYGRLATAAALVSNWKIHSFDLAAIARHTVLRAQKLNIRKMDLRIAAIVLENNGILVTRNARDFQRVPNLALEDWSQ